MKRFIEAARKLSLFRSDVQRDAAQDFLELAKDRGNPNFEAESKKYLTLAVGKGRFFGLFKTKEQRATEEYLRLLRNEIMKGESGRGKDAMQFLQHGRENHPKPPKDPNPPQRPQLPQSAATKMIEDLYKNGGRLERISRSAGEIIVRWTDKTGKARETSMWLSSPDKAKAEAAEEFRKLLGPSWQVTAQELGFEPVAAKQSHQPVQEWLSKIYAKGGVLKGIGRVGNQLHVHWIDEHGKDNNKSLSSSHQNAGVRLQAAELDSLLGNRASVTAEDLGLYDTPAKLAAYLEQKHGVQLFAPQSSYARSVAAIRSQPAFQAP